MELSLDELVDRFTAVHDDLAVARSPQRHFCGLYLRSTLSMRRELALERGAFRDRAWVQRWTVAFAGLYLDALEQWRAGGAVGLPWLLAFEAPHDLPPMTHELVGLNAHLNFDLPRALLAVLSPGDLEDAAQRDLRQSDFDHVDEVMLRRIPEEYRHLRGLSGPLGQEVLARLLYPLNLRASRRWLVQARRAVWHNALELALAQAAGEQALARRVADLDVLCAAKVADLLRPGQVLLRLGVSGFGVQLPARPAPALPLPRSPHRGLPLASAP